MADTVTDRKVSTAAERDTWDMKRVLQLERQHHKFTAESAKDGGEVAKLLEAIRITDGTLPKSLNTHVGMLDPDTGNVAMDVRKAGAHVNGKQVSLVEFFASGEQTYDIRFLHLPATEEIADQIPDDVFAGGAEILMWRKDVPLAWMFNTLGEMFGFDLTKSITPERLLRAILDDLNETFVKCECDECKAAAKAASENKTEVADEKRKILQAAGDASWDDIWAKLDATRLIVSLSDMDEEGRKRISEALSRSKLHAMPSSKAN